MTTTGEEHRAAGGPWWWQRRRSAVLDVVLAGVSARECAVEGAVFTDRVGLGSGLGVLLGLGVGSVLVLRRRWPVAVVLVALAVSPAEMGMGLGFVGLYPLAASAVPRRITAVLASMSGLGSLLVSLVRMGQHVDESGAATTPWFTPSMAVLVALGATAPPVLLGLYVGARRRLMESLRERADSLERELQLLAERPEERAEWARGAERRRIAREMHDVVAHRVSLMVVHSTALQAVALKDPEAAAKNAALVGDMGRQALTELREMLGVMRASSGVPVARAAEPEPEPVVAVPEPRAVLVEEEQGPSLAELDELVGQSRAAGMAVEFSVEGEGSGYGARVERTAYRVVEEALTNAHKQAAGAATRVRLARRAGEVAMQAENGPPPEGGVDVKLPSGGNGLVGMRERVLALGGVFVAGPTDAGGFRVSAVLPVGE
ncbi:sensor histidine kinase [Streptomyces sp. NEAU-H3]|uniref:sensor histidine kinase n=1 Tax=Streptomyces sp. NEAU-H3 TaxID=2720636 RepID=UPI00143A6C39|nr:histidine kinase [Streptomyces sp. NEAU-H3]NJA55432.1 sensor histidine kinase [Streptomyces sp. NEAU-H3]